MMSLGVSRMSLNPCFRGLLVIDISKLPMYEDEDQGLNPCFRGLLVIDW